MVPVDFAAQKIVYLRIYIAEREGMKFFSAVGPIDVITFLVLTFLSLLSKGYPTPTFEVSTSAIDNNIGYRGSLSAKYQIDLQLFISETSKWEVHDILKHVIVSGEVLAQCQIRIGSVEVLRFNPGSLSDKDIITEEIGNLLLGQSRRKRSIAFFYLQFYPDGYSIKSVKSLNGFSFTESTPGYRKFVGTAWLFRAGYYDPVLDRNKQPMSFNIEAHEIVSN